MTDEERFEVVLRELGQVLLKLGDLRENLVVVGAQVIALDRRRDLRSPGEVGPLSPRTRRRGAVRAWPRGPSSLTSTLPRAGLGITESAPANRRNE